MENPRVEVQLGFQRALDCLGFAEAVLLAFERQVERRVNRHWAIIGLAPVRRDRGEDAVSAPRLGEIRGDALRYLARQVAAESFNVITVVPGTNKSAAPLVVMTPRSGWWWCASERGGGLACWLETMRATRAAKPVRDVLFVASSGHELGHRGIDSFIERRPGLVSAAKAWIHLGANIGAAQGPGNNLQASDDEMESMMAEVVTKVGLPIDRRLPRGAVPRGEAENVHRGGGRYISIIGNNDLFHNTNDRGADAVDLKIIERFAGAFAMVATSLASA